MDGFVSAYSKVTGIKQRVPAHWLNHPTLGRNLTLTPRARDGLRYPDGTPAVEWKADQLRAWAEDHDVDLTGATGSKADMVAAIATATAGAADPAASNEAQGPENT